MRLPAPLLGLCLLAPLPAAAEGPSYDYVQVDYLQVVSDDIGTGVGSGSIELWQFTLGLGVRYIRRTSDPAKRLYKELGFRVIEEKESEFVMRFDAQRIGILRQVARRRRASTCLGLPISGGGPARDAGW